MKALSRHAALLLVISCALTAALIDLGHWHVDNNSDIVLPALVSLYRWKLFYWGQNRFGMLLPLLAMPVRSPFWNLVLESGLALFGGLVAFLGLARFALGPSRWVPAAVLSVGSAIALTPTGYLNVLFNLGQVYGPGIALLMGGLVVLTPGDGRHTPLRGVCGTVLLLLGHYVNVTDALLGAPLLVLRSLLGPSELRAPSARAFDRANRIPLALLVAVAVVYWALSRIGPLHGATMLNPAYPSEWPHAWAMLAREAWKLSELGPRDLVLGLLAVMGLVLAVLPRTRAEAGPFVRGAIVLAGMAVLYFVVIGTLRWTRENDYAVRYTFPSLLLLRVALSALAAVPVRQVLGMGTAAIASATSLVLLPALALQIYGAPGPGVVEADLDRTLGGHTAVLNQAGVTHLAGGYWTVWVTVFHANMKRFERGDGRVLWGVSYRSTPESEVWGPLTPDRIRVARPAGDEEAQQWLDYYHFPPLAVTERRGTIELYSPR